MIETSEKTVSEPIQTESLMSEAGGSLMTLAKVHESPVCEPILRGEPGSAQIAVTELRATVAGPLEPLGPSLTEASAESLTGASAEASAEALTELSAESSTGASAEASAESSTGASAEASAVASAEALTAAATAALTEALTEAFGELNRCILESESRQCSTIEAALQKWEGERESKAAERLMEVEAMRMRSQSEINRILRVMWLGTGVAAGCALSALYLFRN